jgi:hypothetical protein
MKKWLIRLSLGVLALVVVIQLVPYGRDHTNPPITAEPAWPSPEVRALAVRACFDCHSNETRWPWYSHVAPVSWLVQSDTMEGRAELNFSEWDRPQKEADEAAEVVTKGEMPPLVYFPTHPEARLSKEEQAVLSKGLETIAGTAK